MLLSTVVLEMESAAPRSRLPETVRAAMAATNLPFEADRYEAPSDMRWAHRMRFDLVAGGADGLLEQVREVLDALEAEQIPWEVLEFRDGTPAVGQLWAPGMHGAVEFHVLPGCGLRALDERQLLGMLQRTGDDGRFGADVRRALELIASDEQKLRRALAWRRQWFGTPSSERTRPRLGAAGPLRQVRATCDDRCEMKPMPHRIETPAGVRYGIPVMVDGDRVTYEMVPLDEASFQRAIDEAMGEFHARVLAAEQLLPEPPDHRG